MGINVKRTEQILYLSSRGQTLVEYSILIGIAIAVLFVMSPMIKRITQSMVKVVSDEVGFQHEADQGNREDGGLINTLSRAESDRAQQRLEWVNATGHSLEYRYAEDQTTFTTTNSSLGTRKDR